MFYNDNNWNLIAQIIFKLQNELDITHNNPPFLPRSANLGVSTNLPCEKFIFHSILSFKALTDEKRADKLTDVSKRLGACGFPGNTEADTFEKLTVCLLEEELPEHLMEALH